MKIQLIALKTIDKGGLRGSASVRLDDIIINEIKILDTAKGYRVSLPTIMWIDNGGQKYRKPAIEVPDQLRNEIQKMVLEGYYNQEEFF